MTDVATIETRIADDDTSGLTMVESCTTFLTEYDPDVENEKWFTNRLEIQKSCMKGRAGTAISDADIDRIALLECRAYATTFQALCEAENLSQEEIDIIAGSVSCDIEDFAVLGIFGY